jgi:hypothetical protein
MNLLTSNEDWLGYRTSSLQRSGCSDVVDCTAAPASAHSGTLAVHWFLVLQSALQEHCRLPSLTLATGFTASLARLWMDATFVVTGRQNEPCVVTVVRMLYIRCTALFKSSWLHEFRVYPPKVLHVAFICMEPVLPQPGHITCNTQLVYGSHLTYI